MKLQNGSLLSKINHGVSFLYFALYFIPPFCTPKCWLQFPQMPSWIAMYGAVYKNQHHHPMMCVIKVFLPEKREGQDQVVLHPEDWHSACVHFFIFHAASGLLTLSRGSMKSSPA